MMLRVDIPPPHPSSSSSSSSTPLIGNKDKKSALGNIVFYACPSTAINHSDGTFLTIGRKNTDVTFASERSVSRSHCNIRLISIDRSVPATVAPDGEDEVEACESSADGMAVVLEDLNSKFGTYFYEDKDKGGVQQKKGKMDDSETDETDDDDVGMSSAPIQSQLSSSAIVPEWIQNKIRKRAQNKVILTSLCLPKDFHTDAHAYNMNTKESPLSTTIQCGNAILNITRIAFNICYSQLRSTDIKKLREASINIGATITSNIDALATTHLVSPSQISTAKSICAWMYGIPIVSMSFINALKERTSINDAMPNEDDHVPPGNLPISDETKKLLDHDPTLPQRCFRGYKVLSLEDSDGEMLCRGAGATVIKLYADENENAQTNSTFWKEDEWWNRLEEKQKDDRLVVVWLTSSKKKLKRGQDFLKKLMKKQEKLGDDADDDEFRIYSTDQSKVAKAITSLSVLENVNGVELKPILASISSEIQSDNFDVKISKKIEEEEDKTVSNCDNDCSVGNRQDELSCSDGDSKDQRIQEAQTNSQHSKIRPSQQSGTAGWMISSQMEHKGSNEEVITAIDEEDEASQQEPKDFARNENLNKKHRKNKLKVTENGWLVAAPQGRKRARYCRSAAELASYGEGPLSDPAQTEHCKSLIIMRAEGNLEDLTPLPDRNVVNFKRFQKNSIITGARMHSLSQIRLRAVLPKESERQRQLADSEQELKREQRVADSLFSGEDDRSMRGKTSIRNYFQVSPKRGTGRRRRA